MTTAVVLQIGVFLEGLGEDKRERWGQERLLAVLYCDFVGLGGDTGGEEGYVPAAGM